MRVRRKKVICSGCNKQFELVVDAIRDNAVTTILRSMRYTATLIERKHIIKCPNPNCGTEHEVRL